MSQIQEELNKVEVETSDTSVRSVGYAVLFLTFGFLGVWSYCAPIDSAAISAGFVAVKDNSKTIQHFDGGIVKRINVRDGKKVKSGDILIELDDTQIKAGFESLISKVVGIESQIKSHKHLEGSFSEEVAELKGLLAEGFAHKQQLRERQRQHANVQASLAKLAAELSGTSEQLRAVKDRLERTVLRAPVNGKVIGLTIHTLGGVIQGGTPILTIVPDGQDLTIMAQVSPRNIDKVRVGLEAEIRLSAFNQNTTPKLLAKVMNLSADRLMNDVTGDAYYMAELNILPSSLDDLSGMELVPGMPAEVLILTGERTVFQYLAKPITDAFARSFLED